MRAVTVFCGSTTGDDPRAAECARSLGTALGRRGLALVYGGGGIGLMGEVARAARASGARVVGVMTHALVAHEQGWDGCDEMLVVDCMRTRKAEMEARGDAFVALPGGLGTYEELLEAITGRVVGRHRKPIGLLDPCGHFAPFLSMVEHGVTRGFVRSAARELLLRESDPERLLDALAGADTDDDPRNLLPMHGVLRSAAQRGGAK